METTIRNLTFKEINDAIPVAHYDQQTICELNKFHDEMDEYYDWLSQAVGENYDFPEDWRI